MDCVFFFFFQAEDGIRDLTVTGVQTCALPILRFGGRGRAIFAPLGAARLSRHAKIARPRPPKRTTHPEAKGTQPSQRRSEERRVGKECKAAWRTEQEKKKSRRTKMYDEE